MDQRVRLYNYKDISFEEALIDEDDIVAQAQQYYDTLTLKACLYQNAAALRQLVAAHLGLASDHIQMDTPQKWLQGSFNLVLPMLIYETAVEPVGPQPTDASIVRRVVLRWPIPSRCGETHHPGALLEKMRCEVASYIWMQRHCPDIRIPQLYGFGLPTGQHFTQACRLPWYRRIALCIRQAMASLLRWPVPSEYLSFQPLPLPPSLVPGYMILEHLGPDVGEVIPLAIRKPETPAHGGDDERRQNLYRSLSRIMLALARVPQPKIGAFCFDPATSTIALANRPVTCDMAMLENEGVPRVMKPGVLYTSAQAYVDQLLAFQDARFLSLANSVSSRDDCELQMSVHVFFRALAHHFRHAPHEHAHEHAHEHDGGPFRLRLTDFNAANFLIDKDWNITAMYDLEWIVAQPLSMHDVPRWITWKSIDACAGKHYDEFSAARAPFIEVFQTEEAAQNKHADVDDKTPISTAIEASWTSGLYWFNASLMSVNALNILTQYRLRHLFGFDELVGKEYWRLWAPDAEAVARQKMQDRAAYVVNLAALFGRDPPVAKGDGDQP